jgi:polar amino acid transport system substrate-binding protein
MGANAMRRRHLLGGSVAAAIVLGRGRRAARGQSPPALRVATDPTFPPFEFSENDKLAGFDIELVEALAATAGRRVEWVAIDFKGLIPGLIAHRFDMAASAIYITPERAKVVDFSAPYYTGGLVILTRRDNAAIKGPADLAGRRVSVQVGTKSVGFLRDNFPQVVRVEVEKNEAMFDLAASGRVDAAVTGRPAALLFARAHPEMVVLAPPLTSEKYGFALRKDEPELRAAIDAALARAREDGSYAKLVAKWFGQE